MNTDTRLAKTLYVWRVRVSLFCVVAAFFLAEPNRLSLLAGSGFIILGLLLRGWACGHLSKDKELTTSGPYRFTRSPLYLGSLLIGIGVTSASRSWWVAGLLAFIFLVFYSVAVQREKNMLQGLFPEAYAAYSRRVPLFFPQLKPDPPNSPRSFDWSRYLANKEYRALEAALVFMALLVLKAILWG